MVDDTFATQLSAGLMQWQNDLAGDGWRVIRHDVSRSDSVEFVKALIYNDMQNDTTAHTLFLFRSCSGSLFRVHESRRSHSNILAHGLRTYIMVIR